jgi:hypothetical protein
MTPLNHLLLGAVAMAALTIGLIFLRLWRQTRDRFFLWFSLSFMVEAVNRIALSLAPSPNEASPWHYSIRFASYLLILLAILGKNRRPNRKEGTSP